MTLSNFIFCDASFHPQLRFGVGGYIITQFKDSSSDIMDKTSSAAIRFITAQNTNNIRMEISTVIAALAYYQEQYSADISRNATVTVFSDCKNVCELSLRRDKLEKQQFLTKKHGIEHPNSDLYRQFYDYCDMLNPKFLWIKGHSPKNGQSHYQAIFGTIDKAVRCQLRSLISQQFVES